MGRRASLAALGVLAAAGLMPVGAPAGVAAPPDAAVTEQPSEAAALAAARASGQRVEVSSLRSATERVFANPSGTFAAEINTLPVRVRQGTGWVPVDTTLRARPDGTVRPAATTVPMALSGGGSAPLARVWWQGRDFALGWPGPLPAPVLDGASATYRDVLPDVDLVVTAGVLGFSEVLVVKTAAAARHPDLALLRLTTTLNGLTARADAGGNISAVDASGTEIFHVGAPLMWDSSGVAASPEERLAGPAPGGRHRGMPARLDAGAIAVRPDQGMLSDPQTRYPVYIDPNVFFAGSRLAWTAVWKKYPNGSYYNSSDIARVGYEAQEGNTNRSFFRMSTSTVRLKHIIRATFRTYETWSWSCSARTVYLWNTGPISSATTWNNQPARIGTSPIASANVAKGWSSSCPAGGVDFAGTAVTSAVAQVAARNAADITFSLAAANEGDTYGWKKFKNNPVLEVEYNSVPYVPTGLSIDPGLPCVTGASRPVIGTATPTFRAKISDPDAGQPVGARFDWWNTGGSKIGERVTAKVASGTVHSATVPSGAFVSGRTYSWRVRAEDGTDVSAFTGWCELTVDTTAPGKRPTVSSTTYPETPVDATTRYGGGIGVTGSFTFAPGTGDTDVVGYVYDFNTYPPTTPVAAGGTGMTATVSFTPTKDLLNTVWVRSKDRVGNLGPEYGYQFYVRPVTFPAGHWKLDETAGTTAADSSGEGRTAAATGGASWVSGRVGGAARFNGTDASAATAGPVLRTDASFTVAAWVRFNGATEWRNYTAVSQDGTVNSGFLLGYLSGQDRWGMSMPSVDGSTETYVSATSTTPPALNAWTHLVGVYDRTAGQLRLYVDGVKVATVAKPATWNAGGALQIGRGKWHGWIGDWWRGDVDDVRVHQGVLPDEAIAGLAHPPAQLVGHWKLDETTGTTAVDSSGAGRNATLSGGAAWGDGWFDGGLGLDGASGQAGTAGPVLRTDQAFTVAAWVSFRGASQPTNYTAVSQDGTGASAFKLGYRYFNGTWAMMMPTADDANTTDVTAVSPLPPALSTWTHLTGVYDPGAGQLRLYVDGVLMALTTFSGGWQGSGGLQIGRARWGGWLVDFWPGAVDDVRVYQGALTDDEIFQLTVQ